MRIVLLVVLGLISHSASSQWFESGGWLGLEINQSLRKDWAWSVQYENRWDSDLTRHKRGILDASIENTFFSAVKVNVQYRYSEERNRMDGYTPQQRLALRLSSEGDIGKGKWQARFMTAKGIGPKSQSMDLNWMEEGQSGRFRLGYQHKRQGHWRWKTDLELFPDLDKFPEQKTRFRWLVSRELNDALSACLGYVWSQEWNAVDAQAQHIVKANLSWTLDRPKKRKKPKPLIPAALVMAADLRDLESPLHPPVCTLESVYVAEVNAKGQPADWIVIANQSDNWCTLKGWRLTDSWEKPGLEFQSIVLPPNGSWKGYEKGQGGFDFGISAKGERLFWIHPEGQMQEVEVRPQSSESPQAIEFFGKSIPLVEPKND